MHSAVKAQELDQVHFATQEPLADKEQVVIAFARAMREKEVAAYLVPPLSPEMAAFSRPPNKGAGSNKDVRPSSKQFAEGFFGRQGRLIQGIGQWSASSSEKSFARSGAPH
jgi:hypothetical protein